MKTKKFQSNFICSEIFLIYSPHCWFIDHLGNNRRGREVHSRSSILFCLWLLFNLCFPQKIVERTFTENERWLRDSAFCNPIKNADFERTLQGILKGRSHTSRKIRYFYLHKIPMGLRSRWQKFWLRRCFFVEMFLFCNSS